ncbi:MAG: hypothetical protein FWH23_07405 [Bacteroidales bacterium]|nr:hypothetical protein [Bacteroidales bacterium]
MKTLTELNNNYKDIDSTNVLSDEEMRNALGGACKSGCEQSCKDSCQPGYKNSSTGGGSINDTKPQEKDLVDKVIDAVL